MWKLNILIYFLRPIRLKMSLSDNMTMMGGREPFYITYKVGNYNIGPRYV